MEQAGEKARHQSRSHSGGCSQIDRVSSGGHGGGHSSAQRQASIYRKVGEVQYPESDVYTQHHEAVEQSLLHGMNYQRFQLLISVLIVGIARSRKSDTPIPAINTEMSSWKL